MTRFENRRIEMTSLTVALATAHRKNPKDHKIPDLVDSFIRFGFTREPMIDEATQTMVAGHGRCLALDDMKRNGWTDRKEKRQRFDPPNGVEVAADGEWMLPIVRGIYFENEAERDAFVIADNQHTMASGWDLEKILAFAPLIGNSVDNWRGLGFESEELESFGVDMAPASIGTFEESDEGSARFDDTGLPDPRDEKPSTRRETMVEETPMPSDEEKTLAITRVGDVIKLGRHVLVCGDSAKDAIGIAVDFFDDGTEECTLADVALVVTDIPWNVAVLGGRRETPNAKRKDAGYREIENDALGADYPAAVETWIAKITEECEPGIPMYLCSSAKEFTMVDARIKAAGWHASTPVVWGKHSWVLGHADYHSQYEQFWYGWRDGAPRTCPVEDRSQGDLWMTDRPKAHKRHPTAKPVSIAARMINNSSHPGDLVLDPFGGSGSTLLACQQTGRRCAMVELDPIHCDDICERFKMLTGIEPVRTRPDPQAKLAIVE